MAHSYLSATSGSTRAARRAGIAHAAMAAITSTATADASTNGSLNRVSNSCFSMPSRSASAPSAPSANPMAISNAPSRAMRVKMRDVVLPSATRMPISAIGSGFAGEACETSDPCLRRPDHPDRRAASAPRPALARLHSASQSRRELFSVGAGIRRQMQLHVLRDRDRHETR